MKLLEPLSNDVSVLTRFWGQKSIVKLKVFYDFVNSKSSDSLSCCCISKGLSAYFALLLAFIFFFLTNEIFD